MKVARKEASYFNKDVMYLLELSEEEASKLKWVLGWDFQIPAMWEKKGHPEEADLYREMSTLIWDGLDAIGVVGWGIRDRHDL